MGCRPRKTSRHIDILVINILVINILVLPSKENEQARIAATRPAVSTRTRADARVATDACIDACVDACAGCVVTVR